MQLLDLPQDARVEHDGQARRISTLERRERLERLPVRLEEGHHLFCKQCGVRPFGRGYVEQIGGDFVSINLAALDNVPDEELAGTPVRFMNGRDNDWFNPPRETRYL